MFVELAPVTGKDQLFMCIDVLVPEDLRPPRLSQVARKYRSRVILLTYNASPGDEQRSDKAERTIA